MIYSSIQCIWWSEFINLFIFKEINTFVQQGHFNLIKNDSKDMYNV